MDWNLLFTIGFTVGLLVIYLPQFWKMISMKSSHGFNQLFMFMGHTASFLSCLNSLIYYINNWWNCHGSLECTESFFGFGLIVFQWLLFWVFYVLYIIYHPQDRHDVVIINSSDSGCECGHLFKTRKIAICFFIASHIIIFLSTVCTLSILGVARWHESEQNPELMIWSGILELLILILFLGHYIPQIYETYQLEQVGSLSLITLGLMCPGTFVWTVYLAMQPGLTNNGQKESHPDATIFNSQLMVWIPYLIVGIMQFILLVIGIYYERRRAKLNKYYVKLNISDDNLIDNNRIDDNRDENSEWI